MRTGKFVVIEGIDGSGKTSVCQRLIHENAALHLVREPGVTPLGESIRTIVKSPELAAKLSAPEKLHYFFTARISGLVDVISPMLCVGQHVLADRFDASTYAYQVATESSGTLAELFWTMRELYIEDLGREPNIYIYLDLEPELAMERMKQDTAKDPDYYDQKGVNFFRRVRHGYLEFFKDGIEYVTVDASKDPDTVYSQVLEHVTKILASERVEKSSEEEVSV